MIKSIHTTLTNQSVTRVRRMRYMAKPSGLTGLAVQPSVYEQRTIPTLKVDKPVLEPAFFNLGLCAIALISCFEF